MPAARYPQAAPLQPLGDSCNITPEQRQYKERTYTFVERMGIERVRAVIVEDSEGIGEALDVALQQSVDATYDPWLEADARKTANQFADLIPAGGE